MVHVRWSIAFACILLLLACGQVSLAATPAPEATPETGGATRDLVSGEVSAALAVLEGTLAPAPAPGAKALTPILDADFISAAANDLLYYALSQNTGGPSNSLDLSGYQRSFSQALASLKPGNQTQTSQDLGASLASTMQSSIENPGFFQSGELAPLVVVIHFAGLDQALTDGFQQFKKHPPTGGFGDNSVVNFDVFDAQTIIDKVSSNGLVKANQSVISALTGAAVSAYGLTPANLLSAQGNATAIGELLFASAYLNKGSIATEAQSLTSSIQAGKLTKQVQQDAFNHAIQKSLQQPAGTASADVTAAVVAAAVGAGSASAVTQAFSQVQTAPLQLLCGTQTAAQGISGAAGQAVSTAIPSSFGPSPCKLFQGADAFLHTSSSNSHAPVASCPTYITGSPSIADCTKAVAALRANQSADCRITNSTVDNTEVTYQLSDKYADFDNVVLGIGGQCQVILGGKIGTALPCATIADSASSLLRACGTSNASTGGVYYPYGAVLAPGSVIQSQTDYPEHAFYPVYIALVQSNFGG